jgi:CspA family cold shock protein
MAEGTIKRLTDRGFGFIKTNGDEDLFFHTSSVEGVRFEELREGQMVEYTVGVGAKGLRAERVVVSVGNHSVDFDEVPERRSKQIERPAMMSVDFGCEIRLNEPRVDQDDLDGDNLAETGIKPRADVLLQESHSGTVMHVDSDLVLIRYDLGDDVVEHAYD